MSGLDIQNLANDIRENGQREPGMFYQGMVLDGWHRYLACVQAGHAFRAVDFGEEGDPVAFVLSRNLHRRHLTGSQRAASIVACKEWKPGGRPKKGAPGAGFPESGQSNKELAKEAEVSERTIAHAKRAQEAGLGKAIRDGEISAKRAAEVANLPKEERAAALESPAPSRPKKESPEEQTIKAMRAEIATLKESLGEATLMAEAAQIHEGNEGFRNLKAVLGELEAVKRRRNELMTENSEQKKQIKHLEKRIKDLTKK